MEPARLHAPTGRPEVTLEDLVEALIGEIQDETLPPDGGRPVPEPDGSLLISGLMRLGEWEELTGRRLDDADHGVADTVGGLIMARLGRVPQQGDEAVAAGLAMRVEALDGRRVAAVRLLPRRSTDEAASSS